MRIRAGLPWAILLLLCIPALFLLKSVGGLYRSLPALQNVLPSSAAPVSSQNPLEGLGIPISTVIREGVPEEAGTVAFQDVTEESGIDFMHLQASDVIDSIKDVTGSGVCFIDYNTDGYPDLYVVNGSGYNYYYDRQPWWYQKKAPTSRLYRNNKDGTFTDVTMKAGVGAKGWGMGCAVGDYDNDGHPDLLITNHGPNRLYRNNGNGTFAEVTRHARLLTPHDENRWSTGAVWGDYDNDGWLDLYVVGYIRFDKHLKPYEPNLSYENPTPYLLNAALYTSQPNSLYHNNRDGTFTDVTEKAAVADASGKGLGAVFTDLDQDGLLDLYVVNEGPRNGLFLNRGDGTFADMSEKSGIGTPQSGRGVAVGDYNNDGLVDIFFTSSANDMNILYKNTAGGGKGIRDRDASKLFEDVSIDAGLGEAFGLGHVGWGTVFVDYDNDGFLDIVVANGSLTPDQDNPKSTIGQRNQLWRNTGDGRFVDVTGHAGEGFTVTRSSRGIAAADYDNDGDIDLFINNNNDYATLLRNGGSSHHALTIRLVGVKSNRDGIGAKVYLKAGPIQGVREIRSGSSYLSQSDMRAHFGLGKQNAVDWVEVRWPSGLIQRLKDITADQSITIIEGEDRVKIAPWQRRGKGPLKVWSPPRDKRPADEDILRIEMIRVAGMSKDRRAVPALIQLLRNPVPEIRHEVVATLADIGDNRALEPLLFMVKDENPEVRAGILKALQRFQADHTLEVVIAALEDRDERVRREAAKTLGLLLKEEQTILRATIYRKRVAVVPLLRRLEDPSPGVRREAVAALGYSESYRAIVPVMDKLKDPNPGVRRQAALAIGLLKDKRAIPPLIEAVNRSDDMPEVRSAAILSLARLESSIIMEPVFMIVDGDDSMERLRALDTVRTLLQEEESVLIHRKGMIGPLAGLLKDPDAEIRMAAVRALALMKDREVVPLLAAGLHDTHDAVRREVVAVLANIQDNRAVSHLLPLLSDGQDEKIRKDVVTALARFTDKSAVGPLLKIIDDRHEQTDVRIAAIASLKQIDLSSARHSLPLLADENVPEIRCEVLKLIATSGDRGRIDYLLQNLSGAMPAEVRKEAVLALGVLKDPRGVESLIKIVKARDATDDLRAAAISALGAVGDERAVIHLMGIARNPRDSRRADAVKALSRFRNEAVETFLRGLVKEKNEAIHLRTAALTGWLGMAPAGAIDILTEPQ